MAARLRVAGFAEKDVIVAGPNDRKKNLVLRYRGHRKAQPRSLHRHLDVVEARREDWTTTVKFIEQDGYFYGRGTEDIRERRHAGHQLHSLEKSRLRARPAI